MIDLVADDVRMPQFATRAGFSWGKAADVVRVTALIDRAISKRKVSFAAFERLSVDAARNREQWGACRIPIHSNKVCRDDKTSRRPK
jgi:hypothetical protein